MFHGNRNGAGSGIVLEEDFIPASSVGGTGLDFTSVEGRCFGIETQDGGPGRQDGRGIGLRLVFDRQWDNRLERGVPVELFRAHPTILIYILNLIAISIAGDTLDHLGHNPMVFRRAIGGFPRAFKSNETAGEEGELVAISDPSVDPQAIGRAGADGAGGVCFFGGAGVGDRCAGAGAHLRAGLGVGEHGRQRGERDGRGDATTWRIHVGQFAGRMCVTVGGGCAG